MGYYVKTLPHKKSTPKWKIQFVSYKKKHIAGSKAKKPKKEWDIDPKSWDKLGLMPTMTVTEVRGVAKILNSKLHLKLQEERRLEIERNRTIFEQTRLISFPSPFIQQFEERFIHGRSPQSNRKNFYSQWRGTQKMILALKLEPEYWYENQYAFYDYFFQYAFSLSYIQKLLRLSNLWGFFICQKLGKPFLPVRNPSGYERNRLASAYHEKSRFRYRESDPVTPNMLESIKDKIHPNFYHWLYLSVWLGLRPMEVDHLHDEQYFSIEIDPKKITILWVFQTKLISSRPVKRWKPIPLLFPEQKKVVQIIKSGRFHRPLVKTVKHYFGPNTSLYGGRKGFTDLMLDRNQQLENIAQWMGHSSIERTWRSYKNRRIFHYTLPQSS